MLTNWAGNYTYHAPHLRQADNIEAAQEIVASAQNLRVLGSRHSFNAIADSSETLLSLSALNKVLDVDLERRRVTVEGGIRYGDLAPVLQQHGLALSNLASLPHISVAGAIATATHGSGSQTGNLATSVVAIDFIAPSGEIVTYSRDADPETFSGVAVHLGALGPVARMVLAVEPTYQVRQNLYTGLTHDALASNFDALFASAKSVSVFTDWRGETTSAVWVKEVVDMTQPLPPASTDFFGGQAATRNMHPLPDGNAGDCTDQMGVPGPWHERLPHFKMEFSPSNGAEIQAEYFMPRDVAPQAIAAMQKHGERMADVLMISEVRTVAADDLWMSPGSRGPYFAFHFTFKRDWPAVRSVLQVMEADLRPLGAVPHWGKVTAMSPSDVMQHYARLGDFRDLITAHDPKGKFRNDFIRQHIIDVR